MKKTQAKHEVGCHSLRLYQATYHEQISLNNDFHSFVDKYQEAYKGPNKAGHQINSPVAGLGKIEVLEIWTAN